MHILCRGIQYIKHIFQCLHIHRIHVAVIGFTSPLLGLSQIKMLYDQK